MRKAIKFTIAVIASLFLYMVMSDMDYQTAKDEDKAYNVRD